MIRMVEQSYEYLGLSTDASAEEIEHAFFLKVVDFHQSRRAFDVLTGRSRPRPEARLEPDSQFARTRERSILARIFREFWLRHGIIMNDNMAFQRLLQAAEEASLVLESKDQAEIGLPFIYSRSEKEPLHLELTITRQELEELENGPREDRVRALGTGQGS